MAIKEQESMTEQQKKTGEIEEKYKVQLVHVNACMYMNEREREREREREKHFK